eukprot:c29246_g1_i4 orf=2836-3672(-)
MQEAWNLANDSLRTTLCVRFKSEVVACGVVYAASLRFSVPLPESPPWWKVFNAEKSEIDEVCRALANLYTQPKGRYVEVCKDLRSFVLTSRAWDPPPESQDLLRIGSNNGIIQDQLVNTDLEAKECIVKIALDKMKSSNWKELRFSDDRSAATANGGLREDSSCGKMKHARGKEDSVVDKRREKDRDLSRARKRDIGKERGCDNETSILWDQGRDGDRDNAADRERKKMKDKDYRIKERRKDAARLEKSRHRLSSRVKEYQNSYTGCEREHHQHQPYG